MTEIEIYAEQPPRYYKDKEGRFQLDKGKELIGMTEKEVKETKEAKEKKEPAKDVMEAKPRIKIVIDGVEKEGVYRTFKSGKKGYGVYGVIKIKDYPYRLSLNLIEF